MAPVTCKQYWAASETEPRELYAFTGPNGEVDSYQWMGPTAVLYSAQIGGPNCKWRFVKATPEQKATYLTKVAL